MKTWLEMKTEIKAERNLQGEDFVTEAELLVWANDARAKAAAEIVTLKDKYFETETTDFALTEGVDTYALPTDIYAAKIIEVHYKQEYEVRPIKRKAELLLVQSGDNYKYSITNSVAAGLRFKLHPASRETSAGNLKLFYIRESQPIAVDADVIDIPIAEGFIKQYILDQITAKEIGPMNVASVSEKLVAERNLMLEALGQMFPSDTAEEIEGDYSSYEEAEGYDY